MDASAADIRSIVQVRSFSWMAINRRGGGGIAILECELDGAIYELTLTAVDKGATVCQENTALAPVLAIPPGGKPHGAWHRASDAVLRLVEEHRDLWELPAAERSAALESVPNYYVGAPVKRHIKSADGKMTACVTDNRYSQNWELPVANPCGHEVPVFTRSDVTLVDVLARHVFKAVLPDGTICALKQVTRYLDPWAPAREATTLAGVPPHPHVVALHGLVSCGEGRVDGLLLSFVIGSLLSEVSSPSRSSCEKWKRQLRSALDHLHAQDPARVWGDPKPDNVFVDAAGNVVIFDFGGGGTCDWVEGELVEKVQGDDLGYDLICTWLDNRRVA